MANTLDNLLSPIYEALDVVSREQVGFITAANTNHSLSRVAENAKAIIPIVGEETAADITPGSNPPDTGDTTVSNVELTIDKHRAVPVRFTGEEQAGLAAGGIYNGIITDRFAQAMRTLANEMEADLWAEAYKGASRAYGTAGTTPFATADDMSDLAGVLKILEDNGAPMGDLQLVLGTGALANLRGKQSNLFKVNESGSTDMLRRGMTELPLMNFRIRGSNQVGLHTPGAAASYVTNGGEPVGETAIAIDTGSGAFAAGDVVTFAGDTEKYVAKSAGTSLVLNAPGMRSAVADNVNVTRSAAFTANVAFSRSSLILATRMPLAPQEGDSAVGSVIVNDAVSGLAFEIRQYNEYRRVHYEVAVAWGKKLVRNNHTALLLG